MAEADYWKKCTTSSRREIEQMNERMEEDYKRCQRFKAIEINKEKELEKLRIKKISLNEKNFSQKKK